MSLYAVSIPMSAASPTRSCRFRPGLSLIWGDNGSGKTSLLEAIFLLGGADRSAHETLSG